VNPRRSTRSLDMGKGSGEERERRTGFLRPLIRSLSTQSMHKKASRLPLDTLRASDKVHCEFDSNDDCTLEAFILELEFNRLNQ
jgi:hypothetical protein